MSMVEMMLGDSMQIMETLKMRFDMIFLDPPYWTGRTETWKQPDPNTLSAQVLHLLKPNGTIFLCSTQPQLLRDWRYWKRFFELNFEIVWDKMLPTPAISDKKPLPTHQNIWCLFRKKDNVAQLKINTALTKGRAKRRKRKGMTRTGRELNHKGRALHEGAGYIKSIYRHTVIKEGHKEYEGHPTQKPLKLMRLIVKISTEPEDWILDPFAGVGTTLVTARELNRNCFGIEINRLYVKLYRRRLERVKYLKKLEKWM